MKKILVVQGGGRANGNTAQLVRHFVKGAEEGGHSVEVVSLIKNEVKGCLGYNACRYGKLCKMPISKCKAFTADINHENVAAWFHKVFMRVEK